MLTKEVTVKSVIGLHARPASALVKLAMKYKSKILLHYQGRQFDAKSMFGVLGAGIKGGEAILISADGEDEAQALEATTELVATMEN